MRTGKKNIKRKIVIIITFLIFIVNFNSLLISDCSASTEGEYGSGIGRFNSVKVADIDNDGNKEIVFGNFEGNIHVLSFKEGVISKKWKSEKSYGSRLWGLELEDIDNDGTIEIIMGNGEGNIYIIDGKTHEEEWKSKSLGSDAHGIEIADLNNDGQKELIVGTGFRTDTGNLYIFDGKNHTLKWQSEKFNSDSRIRGITVDDVDGDGIKEIIAGSGSATGDNAGKGYIRIINGLDYSIEWESENLKGGVEALSIADVDDDGIKEIIAGTGYRFDPGYIYIIDGKTHKIEWKSKDIGPKVFGLAVADVDSDGIVEILAGNQAGYLYIFDGKNRTLEWKSNVLGNDVFGITTDNINNEGDMEIIVCSGGYRSSGGSSAYTISYVYIFNGKTHSTEWQSEGIDYKSLTKQVIILLSIIVILVFINFWFQRRPKNKKNKNSEV